MADRESIRQGFYQKMAAEAHARGLVQPTSEQDRKRSRQKTLSMRPPGAGIWVFAYGSLMWNPAFHYVESRQARLFGHHRSFCLRTSMGRGTKENPGLLLGLDRGGSCAGLAFRIDEGAAHEELDILWSREMVADAYSPVWRTLRSEQDGAGFHAICFVINRFSERYVTDLHPEETAAQIALAAGPLGPCAEYLEKTVGALDHLGITQGPMHRLLKRVKSLQPPPPCKNGELKS